MKKNIKVEIFLVKVKINVYIFFVLYWGWFFVYDLVKFVKFVGFLLEIKIIFGWIWKFLILYDCFIRKLK